MGKPTVTLHLGDCLEILKGIEPGSVDAVVTDPPYGEKTHTGARSSIKCGVSTSTSFAPEGHRATVTFSPITAESFVIHCREWVRVARRWVIATCDWRHAAAAEESDLPVVRLGVWIKPDAAPQFTGDRPGTGWEAILMLHRPWKKRWNGGGTHAVWRCPRDRSAIHPSVKPLPLIERWLEQFTDPGDTILDPFMGSGTTGVACLRTGRNFIGIEIDPAYFAIAQKRIAAEQAKTPLLDMIEA